MNPYRSAYSTRVLRCRRIFAVAALIWTSIPTLMCASDGALSLTLSSGVASDHVYRGIERAGTVWQSSFYGSVADWKGRVWLGKPVDSDGLEEVQSSLGRSWAIGAASAIEITGMHFWYVDPPVDGAPVHSFEGAVRFSSTTRDGWKPSLQCAYDIRYRARSVEISIAREFLTDAGSWELRAYTGQVAARDVLPDSGEAALHDNYVYYGADCDLRRKLSAHWSVQGRIGVVGSTNLNAAWSALPPQTARGRFALSALYQF